MNKINKAVVTAATPATGLFWLALLPLLVYFLVVWVTESLCCSTAVILAIVCLHVLDWLPLLDCHLVFHRTPAPKADQHFSSTVSKSSVKGPLQFYLCWVQWALVLHLFQVNNRSSPFWSPLLTAFPPFSLSILPPLHCHVSLLSGLMYLAVPPPLQLSTQPSLCLSFIPVFSLICCVFQLGHRWPKLGWIWLACYYCSSYICGCVVGCTSSVRCLGTESH